MLAILFILVAYASNLSANSLSESLSGESLIVPPPVEAVSFGLNYDEGKRQINYGSKNIEELYSRSYSFYIGYDITKWCTVFATVGSSSAKLSENQNFQDGKTKWSIGVNANLWHIEIENPTLFTGRISLKPAIEFAQCNSGANNETLKWTDISGALFLAYEKRIDDPKYSLMEFYGYSLYAGPALSLISGTKNNEDDFNEERSLGLIGGLDFFITQNLSIGGQVQSFDEISFGGNIRYHF